MADMPLKQMTLEVKSKEEKKTAKGTVFYNVESNMGVRFSIWDAGVAGHIVPDGEYSVKYSEKPAEYNGKTYTNRTIEAVEVDGKWVEAAKKSFGGGKTYDSEGAAIGNAINGASALMAAPFFETRLVKKTDAEIAEVWTFFINHAYAVSKRLRGAAANGATKATNGAAKAPPKAAPVEEEVEMEEVA